MKLELKHLAPYLPYKLRIQGENYGQIGILSLLSEASVNIEGRNNTYGMWADIDDIKPILRPMSDLTKETQIKEEILTPLVRLLELKEKNSFSNDNLLKSISQGYSVKVIECSTKEYSGFNEHKISYPIETSNMGTLVYSFGYSERFSRFRQRDETYSKPLGVGYQKQLFEQLYEWHFDLNNLIPSGLAVDINTLS